MASSGWHRHGPRLHQGAADLCSAAPDGVPVLVVDLAGAREQIARALIGAPRSARRPHTMEGALTLAEAVLAALGAPEEGEGRG